MSSMEYLAQILCNPRNLEEIKATGIKKRNSPFKKFMNDGLTIKYEGTGLYYMDIASVQKAFLLINNCGTIFKIRVSYSKLQNN